MSDDPVVIVAGNNIITISALNDAPLTLIIEPLFATVLTLSSEAKLPDVAPLASKEILLLPAAKLLLLLSFLQLNNDKVAKTDKMIQRFFMILFF